MKKNGNVSKNKLAIIKIKTRKNHVRIKNILIVI